MVRIKTFLYEIKNKINIYFIRKKIKVASLEETIDIIIKDGCSISRFGDGEFYMMDGGGIKFQKADQKLAERLKTIIRKNENGHLICISNGINPKNYKEFTKKHIIWMKKHFDDTIDLHLKYIDKQRQYYNLLISRFWIPYKDKERARKIAAKLKTVWYDRDVVVIEGEKTRMGVGNDLLSEVKSCKRILCPATDAFDKYDEILSVAKTFPKGTLFLIALGPTATVLAYDLYKEGYQALDIGHVDLEYEWMRLNATEQINLSNRYCNELSGGDVVANCSDETYLSEIKYVIS